MAKSTKTSKVSASIVTPEQVAELTGDNTVAWAPQPGPQTVAMWRDEYEIFYGGAKGGGKSFSIIGWLLKGNPFVPLDKASPIDLSYINCPTYRALVIRRNLEDLNSWIAEANSVYGKLGATYTQRPSEFAFPSGAKIIMGHLDDDKAVEKYFGNVVHRAAIDELTFIDSFRNYMRLVSCVRSNVKGIKPQVFSTGNPGGPGTNWVLERFVEPQDADGNIIVPMTTIREKVWNPIVKKMEEKTRIFIPSKLGDNPKLLEADPGYVTTLAMMPEAERKAYLDGDWHSLGGTFFPEFRAKHREGEPPEACHVIPSGSRPLLPWLPRFAACDWGFGHAAVVYGAVKDLNGQTVVHRELVLNKTGSVELGDAIGRLFLPDLEGLYREGVEPLITLYLSPDAFAKRDVVKTQAEGIAEGIARVLGQNSVHLPEIFTPVNMEGVSSENLLLGQRRIQEKSGISIAQAQNARRAGAAHVREMLRWRQIAPEITTEFDPKIYYTLLHESSEKAAKYADAYKKRAPEVLPKLIIEDHCKHLISSIPALVCDKDDLEDVLKTEALSDDVYDAIRYLVFSQSVSDNREPEKSFVHRHLAKVKSQDPNIDYNSLVWAARWAEDEYKTQGQDQRAFSVPLESSRRHGKRLVH